jgi:hypothetical protein
MSMPIVQTVASPLLYGAAGAAGWWLASHQLPTNGGNSGSGLSKMKEMIGTVSSAALGSDMVVRTMVKGSNGNAPGGSSGGGSELSIPASVLANMIQALATGLKYVVLPGGLIFTVYYYSGVLSTTKLLTWIGIATTEQIEEARNTLDNCCEESRSMNEHLRQENARSFKDVSERIEESKNEAQEKHYSRLKKINELENKLEQAVQHMAMLIENRYVEARKSLSYDFPQVPATTRARKVSYHD